MGRSSPRGRGQAPRAPIPPFARPFHTPKASLRQPPLAEDAIASLAIGDCLVSREGFRCRGQARCRGRSPTSRPRSFPLLGPCDCWLPQPGPGTARGPFRRVLEGPSDRSRVPRIGRGRAEGRSLNPSMTDPAPTANSATTRYNVFLLLVGGPGRPSLRR